MLNTKNYNWTKIRTLFETRLWHTAVYNEESSQVYVFGGSLTDIYANSPILPEHLLKISLTPEPLKRLVFYIFNIKFLMLTYSFFQEMCKFYL